MKSQLTLLLVLLQLWHHGMANSRVLVEELHEVNEVNRTVSMMPIAGSATNFPIQIGNKFYHVETTTEVSWYEAAHKCRQLGGHLLNIESEKEMDQLLSIVPAERYWISANCLAKNREWISISTGEAMPYMKWHPREPNNLGGNEFCVEIKRTALNDDRCPLSLFYICEAKII